MSSSTTPMCLTLGPYKNKPEGTKTCHIQSSNLKQVHTVAVAALLLPILAMSYKVLTREKPIDSRILFWQKIAVLSCMPACNSNEVNKRLTGIKISMCINLLEQELATYSLPSD